MIKNYTSNSPNTFNLIQQSLVSHGAKQIFFDYNKDGTIKALAFTLEINGKYYAFRLPARVEKVEMVMYGRHDLTIEQRQQAYRTAWANIRDWITAQLALIETEQVKMEEVFLPYLVIEGDRTLFEDSQEKRFLLPEGKE